MIIKLCPTLEKFVRQRMRRGGYRSADELINTALIMLQSNESTAASATEALRRKIRVGLDQLDRDEHIKFTADNIRRQGRRLLAARHRK